MRAIKEPAKPADVIVTDVSKITCKYTYNQRVKINSGFYKGYYCIIKGVQTINGQVIYSAVVTLDNKTQSISMSEESLSDYTHIPFINP
jgi:hypothetical protein